MKNYPVYIKSGTKVVGVGSLADGRDKIFDNIVKQVRTDSRLKLV